VIRTIDDARNWHSSVQRLAGLVNRLARRYWSEESGSKTLAETIHRDDDFREMEAADLEQLAKRVLEDLDDLAVLLIFSVFEAQVRDLALEGLEEITPTIPEHPVLVKAIDEARERIEHGSFFRLTESYGAGHIDLRTQVDQIRRFRNWVAHGRRGQAAQNVTPESAADRLRRFLQALEPPPPAE